MAGEYSRTMSGAIRIAGIDGCRGGWFVAAANENLRNVEVFVADTIDAAMQRLGADAIAGIDIPIGLPDAGPRDCDQQARRLLSPRRTSSVFPAPLRSILGISDYEEACDRREAIDGRRISVQAFNILAKIDEVDRYLRASGARRLYEVHPELAFAALNGGDPMAHPKRSREGLRERRRVLRLRFDGATVDGALDAYPRSQVARDDALDALAVLVSTCRIASGRARRVPEQPVCDAAGLDMAIWF